MVEKFINLKDEADLDIIADIVTARAFDKITSFEEKRPLVDRIKKADEKPEKVSIDECLCCLVRVKGEDFE